MGIKIRYTFRISEANLVWLCNRQVSLIRGCWLDWQNLCKATRRGYNGNLKSLSFFMMRI